MSDPSHDWTLLVYKIPPQPSRLRLAVWRRLQKMGAFYLQDAVCLLPARPDLTENLSYVAGMVEEMGGTCHLFNATALLPGGAEALTADFRAAADERLGHITERLDEVLAALLTTDGPADLERAEEDLRRERVAYLRARKLAYLGATPAREAEVEERLDRLRTQLDEAHRGGGK